MSKPKYAWWGYAREIMRRYPNQITEHERLAVEKTMEDIERLPDANERLTVINALYIKGTHTLDGAAIEARVSYSTARRYQAHALKQVGYHMGLM